MKRHNITPELKEAIRKSGLSMDKFSQKVNFNIKNIIFCNQTIREDVLNRINSFLGSNMVLEEINLEYERNLGKSALTKPIKQIEQGEDLAEFVGIMLGDGNFCGNQIVISFDNRGKGYISHVKSLAQNLTGIGLKGLKEKSVNGFRLYCCNKFLAEKLIEFGLKRGDKIMNQIGIPNWIKENREYSKRCIKGLVDTDGCIIFCKRDKQKHICFTNRNLQLLNDFKEVTKNLGYNFAKANKWNKRLYRKAEVVRFINEIKPFKANGAVV